MDRVKEILSFSAVLCVFVLLIAVSCTKKVATAEPGRVPVASIDGYFLYYDELAKVMSPGLSAEDSAMFADKYIKNWVSELLFYQNAEKNIPDTREIDQLVENYRHALIVHSYEQKLVEQKSVASVSETAIKTFYDENQGLFILEEPVIKGVFIQLPLKTSNLNKVRKCYTDTTSRSLDELEKFCILNAVRYEPFYDSWTPLSHIKSILPPTIGVLENLLSSKKNIEIKDESFVYFLNVTDMVRRGEPEPLEKAHDKIRSLIQNNIEVSYIEGIKEELYQNALKKERIEFY